MTKQSKRIWVRASTLAIAISIVAGSELNAAARPVSIGVNASYEQNLARSANLGWDRIDIVWKDINTGPGIFDFTATDNVINYALSQGQQILGHLSHVPDYLGGGSQHNIPPLTTNEWSDFVSRVAQRYRGKIAAYEIWNEPDIGSSSTEGVGWGRNIEQPPLYIDFVHAAAVQIRANAPGTLVVAPAFLSRNDGSGVDNRKRRIFQQIQAASYSDGAGPSFIDVVSFHSNASATEGAGTMANTLLNQNLAYLANYCPSLRSKPIWVTEFGWRTNAVGFDGQRRYICEYLRLQTGSWNASQTQLDQWNITRSFIYLLKDPGNSTSAVIFAPNSTPNPVVTQYLQLLSYPAVQGTVVNGDYDFPSCFGPQALAIASPPSIKADDWAALGLADPRASLPAGFSVTREERALDGRGLDVTFEDSQGGRIQLSVAALQPGSDAGYLTDAGVAWTNRAARVAISGMRASKPIGKAALRSLATALDPSFPHACIFESTTARDASIRRLGLHIPAAPAGFSLSGQLLELTRATGDCAKGPHATSATFDFTWTFVGKKGAVLRAGVYNYGYPAGGPQRSRLDERSLTWSDSSGARYWVAADATTDPQRVQDEIYLLANSLDPAFGL